MPCLTLLQHFGKVLAGWRSKLEEGITSVRKTKEWRAVHAREEEEGPEESSAPIIDRPPQAERYWNNDAFLRSVSRLRKLAVYNADSHFHATLANVAFAGFLLDYLFQVKPAVRSLRELTRNPLGTGVAQPPTFNSARFWSCYAV